MEFLNQYVIFENPIGVSENEIPPSSENVEGWTESQIKEFSQVKKYLSERNSTGVYLVPIEEEKVLLNILPQKRFMKDSKISDLVDTNFNFFPDIDYADELTPEFTLPEGEFFRIANEGIKPKEDYQYYVVQNGDISALPNYKTLEVMLAERNKTLNSVRVLEPKDFELLQKSAAEGNASGTAIDTSAIDDPAAASSLSSGGSGTPVQDKTSEWTEDIAQQTTAEVFEELVSTAESAEAVAEEAANQAQQNIDMAIADAEAARAEAEAARAEAEAAIAASENEEDNS